MLSIIRRFQHIRADKVSPLVLTYTLYGDAKKVKVFGRVVEEIKKHDFSKHKRRLIHFYQVIKLFITIKYDCARVNTTFRNCSVDLKTDDEGFFYGIIESETSDLCPLESVKFKITSLDGKKISPIKESIYESKIVKPTQNTKRIIVSDIDDTVMKSKATNFGKVILRTLFSTVSHRKTFPEAAEVYSLLKVGEQGNEENMFFYVSSSTWNIYPLLDGFLKINKFPEGVILLQDVASEKLKEHKNSHGHKLDRITEVADFYPNFGLILIGDAGQQDAEIYLQIAERYPRRVDKILIRKTWWTDVLVDHQPYLDRAKALGVEMYYFEHLNEINFY